MQINDKINIIDNKINNIECHIDILSQDIINNPNSDVEGKESRQSVLNRFKEKKIFLENELLALTNQG